MDGKLGLFFLLIPFIVSTPRSADIRKILVVLLFLTRLLLLLLLALFHWITTLIASLWASKTLTKVLEGDDEGQEELESGSIIMKK